MRNPPGTSGRSSSYSMPNSSFHSFSQSVPPSHMSSHSCSYSAWICTADFGACSSWSKQSSLCSQAVVTASTPASRGIYLVAYRFISRLLSCCWCYPARSATPARFPLSSARTSGGFWWTPTRSGRRADCRCSICRPNSPVRS